MKNFTDSMHCKSRIFCNKCRSSQDWRATVGAPDECPHGVKGLGDVIEGMAKPIAVALNLPCLDKDKKLRPESPCAKRRNFLNKISL
jgi:hypothetical protein